MAGLHVCGCGVRQGAGDAAGAALPFQACGGGGVVGGVGGCGAAKPGAVCRGVAAHGGASGGVCGGCYGVPCASGAGGVLSIPSVCSAGDEAVSGACAGGCSG